MGVIMASSHEYLMYSDRINPVTLSSPTQWILSM